MDRRYIAAYNKSSRRCDTNASSAITTMQPCSEGHIMTVSSLSFRAYVANLSGRRLGSFKAASVKLGITFEDYIDRVEKGQKNCTDCKQWKDRGLFRIDLSRWDGLCSKCTECASSRGKESYVPVEAGDLSRMGSKRDNCRDNDKKHARHLVNLEVRTNKRPNPNDLFCAKCGHKGADKRHEYHHHMGYSQEHVYDVVVLCSSCHSVEHNS